jgi:hypothetical protein
LIGGSAGHPGDRNANGRSCDSLTGLSTTVDKLPMMFADSIS